MDKWSYQVKFIITLGPLTILMVLFPFAFEYAEEQTAWYITIVAMMIIGVCLGLLTCVVLGIAGMLESVFVGSMLQGQSLSAIIVLIVRLICLLIFDKKNSDTLFYGTILYFLISAFVLFLALISTPVLNFLKELIFYLVLSKISLCSVLHKKEVNGNYDYY